MAYPYTYSAVTYTSPSGAVDIDITIPSGTGVSETTNREFYLLDIGDMEFVSDPPQRSDTQATSIQTKQGEFKIKVWDNFKDSSVSVFDKLKGLSINKVLRVVVTVGSDEFIYGFEQGNIKRDEKDNFTELTFSPIVKFERGDTSTFTKDTTGLNIQVDALVTAVDTVITPDLTKYSPPSPSTVKYISANDLVRYGMLSLFEQSLTGTNYKIISPTVDHNDGAGTANFAMLRTPVLDQNDFYVRVSTQIPVAQAISRLAAISGSYYGYAFGQCYFVDRLSQNDQVTLSWNRVLVAKPNFNLDPVRKVTVGSDDWSGDDTMFVLGNIERNNTDAGVVLNNTSSQEYTVKFIRYVNQARFEETDGGGINRLAGSNLLNLLNDTQDNAVVSYSTALSFSAPRSVEFKYRGFSTLKPYNTFVFGANTPEEIRYKTGTTDAIYRPSSLKYNAKEDTVTVKAYLIN